MQYGLIAEEAADVYPDLVARSADGQVESVKYQVLDSMLLNELQRKQRTMSRLEEGVIRADRSGGILRMRRGKVSTRGR